jgi:tetratricopeptide (TPR) repeat protein
MKKLFFLMIGVCGFLSQLPTYAQEERDIEVEQSAEVFLEEYSDIFQENFFEGLKQKGIRNYDRAITYFLECKRLQPQNTVVSFELAKFHLYDKQLALAQEYALEAVNGEPENYWYAETLVNIIEARKSVLEELKDDLPHNNTELRSNFAEIYFLKGDYVTAQSILKVLKATKANQRLNQRINDSLEIQKEKISSIEVLSKKVSSEALNGLEEYKSKINEMLTTNLDAAKLLSTSEEAIESFPSQPFFYYANGIALDRMQKYNDAIEVLEMALDYLIDDIALESKIYKELANAYTAINNTSKANMYLSKIKFGF